MCVCVLLTFYRFYYLTENLSITKLKAEKTFTINSAVLLLELCRLGQLDTFFVFSTEQAKKALISSRFYC